MKQLFQSLATGLINIEEVPAPAVSKGNLLIKTKTTLISTEQKNLF